MARKRSSGGDEDDRCRLLGGWMNRLAHLDEPQAAPGDQVDPALQRSEVPRGGVGEVAAEAGPRSGAPSILIWLVAAGDDWMERLDDERAAFPEQRWRGKVERSLRYVLVGCDAELPTSGDTGLVDEHGDGIDPDGLLHPALDERPRE